MGLSCNLGHGRNNRSAQQPACQFCSVGAYWECLRQALEKVDPVAYRMVGEPGSALSGLKFDDVGQHAAEPVRPGMP